MTGKYYKNIPDISYIFLLSITWMDYKNKKCKLHNIYLEILVTYWVMGLWPYPTSIGRVSENMNKLLGWQTIGFLSILGERI